MSTLDSTHSSLNSAMISHKLFKSMSLIISALLELCIHSSSHSNYIICMLLVFGFCLLIYPFPYNFERIFQLENEGISNYMNPKRMP